MGRKPEAAQAMTGAERQARYRARHDLPADAMAAMHRRPPGNSRTATRVRRWDRSGRRHLSPCRPSTPHGCKPCPRQPATDRPARRCRPSSISIWTRSSPSSRRAASAGTRPPHASTRRSRPHRAACAGGSTGCWPALRSACRVRALRSARQQPVDYLHKRVAPQTPLIVATWGDQFSMSPVDQFWMSFDRQKGACRRTRTWPLATWCGAGSRVGSNGKTRQGPYASGAPAGRWFRGSRGRDRRGAAGQAGGAGGASGGSNG